MASERDSLGRNDRPATSTSEIDQNEIIKAMESLQKMDLYTLRKLLNSNFLSDRHSGQHASPRFARNDDLSTKYMDLKAKYDKLKNEIEEKKKLNDKLKDLEDQLKNMEQKALEPQKELVLLKQRAKNGDEKLQECMKELEVKSKTLETQAKEMEELRKAKDDALTRDSTNAKKESEYLFMALKCLLEHVRDLAEGKTRDDISSTMYQLGSSIDKESLASQGASHAIAISRIQMKMKSELDNVYGRISQISTTFSENKGASVTQSPPKIDLTTATGRKRRSIPFQSTDQSQQALQFEKDVELITSKFNYLKEKES